MTFGTTLVYSPYGLPLYDSTCIQYIVQYESCQIIVDLGNMYNDKIEILNCKIKLQNGKNIY